MGFLDGMLGNVMGGGSSQNPLMGIAMNFVQQHGGLEGLLKQFQDKGMGAQVASWIGTGENLPISGEQLQQALGHANVADLAQKAGMDPQQVSGQLADLLPNVVNQLSPEGKLPQGGELMAASMKLFG